MQLKVILLLQHAAQLLQSVVCRKIDLNRNNGYVTLFKCPLVSICSLRLVVIKATCKPIVVTAIRVGALVELVLPIAAGLSANLDALNLVNGQYRNIYIQT